MVLCEKCFRPYEGEECLNCIINPVKSKGIGNYTSTLLLTFAVLAMFGFAGFSIYFYFSNYQEIENLKKERDALRAEVENTKNYYTGILNHYKKSDNEFWEECKKKYARTEPIRKTQKQHHVNVTKHSNEKEFISSWPNNMKRNSNKNINKNYPSYSNAIKLHSGSKITRLPNNKLTSTQPIFGVYKDLLLDRPSCKDFYKNRYKLHSDCRIITPFGDELYFRKNHAGEILAYAKDVLHRKNKIIRCEYQKEYGLMHNCMVRDF